MDPTFEKLTAALTDSLQKTFESIQVINIPIESVAKQIALEVTGSARLDSKGQPITGFAVTK